MVRCDRPVGDLGYIQPNARGVVKEKREDGLISLSGSHSIIGRVIDVSNSLLSLHNPKHLANEISSECSEKASRQAHGRSR